MSRTGRPANVLAQRWSKRHEHTLSCLQNCLDWRLLVIAPTLSLERLARAPPPADPIDVRGVDPGVIVLGELLPPAPIPSAAGDKTVVASYSAAMEEDIDAEKKRLVGLAGRPVFSLTSQVAAVAASRNDDDDAGLRSRLTGGGEFLVTAGDLHLFCAFAAISCPCVPFAAAGCPTHLLVVT